MFSKMYTELRNSLVILAQPIDFETGCKNLRANLKVINKLAIKLREAQERRDEEQIEKDRNDYYNTKELR